MKNLIKFLLFVGLLAAGISALYDYRLRHGGLNIVARATPEKYTLASSPNIDPKSIPTLDALNRERRSLVSSVLPAVVSIKTSKRMPMRRQSGMDPFEFFYRNQRQFRSPNEQATVQNSLGSGVIVSSEGHIVTNNHVVDQVDEIEVQMSDGRTRKARLVGSDERLDVAVLKIDDPEVKPLKFGDSDAVQAGDFVLAVGNPFGFEETVTDGIISSKSRPNRDDAFGNLLQTNCAINPGNSGGPLINLQGEIVGINTAIISRSGTSSGIGFAIPANTVKLALESLLKQGRIIRGYLGIYMDSEATSKLSDGVVVQRVEPGSPASEAQIRPGDIVLKFDGKGVHNFTQLRTLVSQTEINKKVDLELSRNGKPLKVSAEIKEPQAADSLARNTPNQSPRAPQMQPTQPQPPQQEPEEGEDDLQDQAPLAGVEVQELTPDLARSLDVPAAVRGVVITKADDGGELRKGDVIEEVNQQPVPTVAEYRKVVSALDPEGTQVLSVCRRRTRSFVVLRAR